MHIGENTRFLHDSVTSFVAAIEKAKEKVLKLKVKIRELFEFIKFVRSLYSPIIEWFYFT